MAAEVRAADYPPPFSSAEVIAAPTDAPDERIEVGVLIVGGGPAGLACAIRLGQLLEEDPATAERLGEVPDRARRQGQAARLAPALGRRHEPARRPAPVQGPPRAARRAFRPTARCRARASTCSPHEARSANPATADAPQPRQLDRLDLADVALPRRAGGGGRARSCSPRRPPTGCSCEHGRVVGIRSGDKGRGREDEPLGNFEPGSDIVAKVTVLAEGTAGHLTGSRARPLRPRRPRAADLGARREGGLARAEAARRRSSTRSAGRSASPPSTASSAARGSIRWART